MSILSALRISRAPATAFVVVGLFWGAFAAQAPVLKDQTGTGDALFGLLLMGNAFGLVIAMWLAPRIDRNFGERTMPYGALLLACMFVLPGLMTSPLAFFVSMALVGFASGLTDVVMNTRVSELEALSKRSLMNANHGMFSVAYAVSALLTGAAREAGLAPVAIFAGVGVVTIGLSLTMKMDILREDAKGAESTRLPWALIGLCGSIVLIAFMAEAAAESWAAIFVERTLGGRAAEGAMGPAMLGLTMAIGRFSGQAVSERLPDLTVIKFAAFLSAAGVIIVALSGTPLVAYVGFGILGLGVSVIGPLGLALIGRMVPNHQRSEAIAKTAILGFSGFFVAPSLMGVTSEIFGLRTAFAMVAVLLLVLPLLAAILRRRGTG